MMFRWSMNEDDFRRIRKDIESQEWTSDNCYRGVAIGSMLWEFTNYDVDGEHFLFANVYEAGVDSGYGELEDGTPYDHVDCYNVKHLDINIDASFEDFKQSVVQKIIDLSHSEAHLREMIEADMKPMWYGFRKENEK